jgi:protein gp37
MAENSKIEWTDHTFNPWTGCTKVSPGCDHCYAEGWAKRSGTVQWGDAPRRRTTEANWKQPVKWNAQAEREGRRFRVFCASLADVFDNTAPAAWRQDLMSLIVRTPHLDWLLLTKRIGNAKRMLSDASMHDGLLLTANDEYRPPPNLWIGATIVNREELLRDAAKLKATPAAMRFWSVEPLLEDLGAIPRELMPDWVIVGGESGPGARPMHHEWARSLREQCQAASVPFLFKQWGEWLPWNQFTSADVDDPPEQTRFATAEWNGQKWVDVGRPGYWESMDGDVDDEQCVGRVGKKAAGRMLDGRAHDEFPTARIATAGTGEDAK